MSRGVYLRRKRLNLESAMAVGYSDDQYLFQSWQADGGSSSMLLPMVPEGIRTHRPWVSFSSDSSPSRSKPCVSQPEAASDADLFHGGSSSPVAHSRKVFMKRMMRTVGNVGQHKRYAPSMAMRPMHLCLKRCLTNFEFEGKHRPLYPTIG